MVSNAEGSMRVNSHIGADMWKSILNIISLIGLAATIWFMLWCYKKGILTSEERMTEFLGQFGCWAGPIFVIIQIVQVIVPIIPGGVSCVVGVVMFGAKLGFIYNYIGICIGSIIAFLIAKYYGWPIIRGLFDEKLIEKYIGWTESNNRFTKLFALAIFSPVAPDDFLCYLAGTTKMKLTTFIAIILLGKPTAIVVYSMGLNLILKFLLKM